MQTIKNNRITMTRGDTLKATVEIKNPDGTAYEPVEGDVFRFAMKKNWDDTESLLTVTIPNDTLLLHIEPNDTKDLDYGEYGYDIQLTHANGDIDTFIAGATIELTEEAD